MSVSACAGRTFQWAVWTLRPLEKLQEALLGEHFHVVLAAAATKSAGLIPARPRKTLFLQFFETTLSGCFLQLPVRVVLMETEM